MTGKVEPCLKFLEEEKYMFQRAIQSFFKVFSDHDIPLELVLKLDQTPLSYVSPRKYTFDLKGWKTVPIKCVYDKRQITATLTVTASVSFLPMQLIYSGKTKSSIPKYGFPSCFNVTFTPNHWPNYKKCVRLFKKIIFPYFKAKKEGLVTQRSSTHWLWWIPSKIKITPKFKHFVWKVIASWLLYPITWWTSSIPLIFLSIKKQRSSSLINSTRGMQIVLVSS